MLYFIQQALNGVHAGALYALLAFGYIVTNGVLHRTNLAYGPIFAFCGQFVILAALFAYDILWLTWPVAIAIAALLALGSGMVVGDVLQRRVLAPLRGAAPNIVVAATLGMAIVLMEAGRIAADSKDVWLPPMLSIPVDFAGAADFRVTLTINQLLDIAAVLVALGFGAWVIERSTFGRYWRAVSDDPLAAELCGIDVARIFRQAVLCGVAAAWLAGTLAALYYGNIGFGTGMVYGLKILFVTAAGSYSSPDRAALGAFAYGVGESLWTGYFAAEWRDGWMLAFLVALLVLRAPARD